MRTPCLIALVSMLAASGCQSEVDKCVSAWEDAQASKTSSYCSHGRVEKREGKNVCVGGRVKSYKQVKAEVRFECLRATSGQ